MGDTKDVAGRNARLAVQRLGRRMAAARAAASPGQFPAGNRAQTPGAGSRPGNGFKGGR